MREFYHLAKSFLAPYDFRVYWNLMLNLLSSLLGGLSMIMFIPVLGILFGTIEQSTTTVLPTNLNGENIINAWAGVAASIANSSYLLVNYLILGLLLYLLFHFRKKYVQLTFPLGTPFRILYWLVSAFTIFFLISLVLFLLGYFNPETLQPFNLSTDNLKGHLYHYIQSLTENMGGTYTLYAVCITIVVLVLLKTLTAFLGGYVMIPLQYGVTRDIRNKIYNKITRLPISFFSNEKKGDIISRMMTDVQEVEASIMSSLNMFINAPIQILTYVFFMFILSWKFTLFAFVLLPIAGGIVGRIGRSLKAPSKLVREELGRLLVSVEETLSGLKVIKIFNAEGMFRKLFHQTNQAYYTINASVTRRYLLASPISEFLGTCIIVILLGVGGYLITYQQSSLRAEEFMAYLALFYNIINPAKSFSSSYYSIQKGTAALSRINELLRAKDKIINKPDTKPLTFNKEIKFENVSFSYKNNTVLKNISLTIKKGESVAIVGRSGSGKTTLMNLLPRLYDVSRGSITVDGVDLRDVDMAKLRNLFGYVQQEPVLFNESIYNNIVLGHDNISTRQLIEATRKAYANDFIKEKEQGYNSPVGDGGNKLSGGQRQRICIARAVLHNPPILLLDEATSALDSESEKIIQNAFEELTENRTVITITHRLSSITHVDTIYVLDDGELKEQGTHLELLAKKGLYYQLRELQETS